MACGTVPAPRERRRSGEAYPAGRLFSPRAKTVALAVGAKNGAEERNEMVVDDEQEEGKDRHGGPLSTLFFRAIYIFPAYVDI
jgi:hypothetical protein